MRRNATRGSTVARQRLTRRWYARSAKVHVFLSKQQEREEQSGRDARNVRGRFTTENEVNDD